MNTMIPVLASLTCLYKNTCTHYPQVSIFNIHFLFVAGVIYEYLRVQIFFDIPTSNLDSIPIVLNRTWLDMGLSQLDWSKPISIQIDPDLGWLCPT